MLSLNLVSAAEPVHIKLANCCFLCYVTDEFTCGIKRAAASRGTDSYSLLCQLLDPFSRDAKGVVLDADWLDRLGVSLID